MKTKKTAIKRWCEFSPSVRREALLALRFVPNAPAMEDQLYRDTSAAQRIAAQILREAARPVRK